MNVDLNNILELFRYEFPDEQTRRQILNTLNDYMSLQRECRMVSDYEIRDITGTSYPIDYTRLEFEVVYQERRTNDTYVVTLGLNSENNRLKEPMKIKFDIDKHKMV